MGEGRGRVNVFGATGEKGRKKKKPTMVISSYGVLRLKT